MISPWRSRLTGGCQCGAVRYELMAPPKRACICHCRMCQKASGQPFMAFATVEAGATCSWTRGAPGVFKSSNVAQRGFCKDCGTPLTFKFEGEEISVTTGSLDDPAAAPPTVQYGVESDDRLVRDARRRCRASAPRTISVRSSRRGSRTISIPTARRERRSCASADRGCKICY